MRIEGDVIYYDHLSQANPDVIGDQRPVKAKIPSFRQSNTPGETHNVDDYLHAEKVGESFFEILQQFSA